MEGHAACHLETRAGRGIKSSDRPGLKAESLPGLRWTAAVAGAMSITI